MFSLVGFHNIPLMLKHPCEHSRTEQLQASFTYSHPYVSEEHAFCILIHIAPAEPLLPNPLLHRAAGQGRYGQS